MGSQNLHLSPDNINLVAALIRGEYFQADHDIPPAHISLWKSVNNLYVSQTLQLANLNDCLDLTLSV